MAWHAVSQVGDPEPGKVKVVEIAGYSIALCNVGGDYYAIDDVCTHDGGPLDQGELEGNEIECPRHGARFDVCTGRVLCLPAIMPVQTYPVKVEGSTLLIET